MHTFGQLFVIILSLYSIALPAPELPSEELAPAASLEQQVAKASRGPLTYIRIALVASDEDLPGLYQAIEEAEHALEPPTEVEGFWARKWHILYRLGADVAQPFARDLPHRAAYNLLFENPPAAFDLRRSFQNARRLLRLSEDFESPWLRNLMVNSATMFAITHGSEFATGAVQGTAHLAQATAAAFAGEATLAQQEIATALAWYGLALPGLYDFGCWIGQGIILVRPTRYGFDKARRATIFVAGKAASYVGLTRLVEFVFERPEVREQLAAALSSSKRKTTLELFVEDEELLRYTVRTADGSPAMHLQFQVNEKQELVLAHAKVQQDTLAQATYKDLKGIFHDFGWNVLGAFRQIRKLLRREQPELIAHEKSFVEESSEGADGWREIVFRPNAVIVKSRLRLADSFKHWISQYGRCVWEMLGYHSPVLPMPPPPTPGTDDE